MKTRLFAGAFGVGLAACLMMIALAAPAAAQTGGVRGKIVDDAGKLLQDVVVVLSSPEGLGDATLKTDAKGATDRLGAYKQGNIVWNQKIGRASCMERVYISVGDV